MDPEIDLLESCPRKSTSVLPKTFSLVTAPILTCDAVNVCYQKNWVDAFPQRRLLWSVLSVNHHESMRHSSDPCIMLTLTWRPAASYAVFEYVFTNTHEDVELIP